MKRILKEFGLQGLTFKQKAIVAYFLVSFCSLCVTEAPVWFIFLIVLNFANAVRLLKQVHLPELEDDKQK